jgi:hypothetical protein
VVLERKNTISIARELIAMRIVTYNLRYGGAGRSHWGKVFAELDPDIFLTQQSYPPDQHVTSSCEAGLHCQASWSPVGKQNWGTAVCLQGHKPSKLDVQHFQGNVVGVEVAEFPWPNPDGCRLRIFSIHASDEGESQTTVHDILDGISQVRNGCDMVIGGDFGLSIGWQHESEAGQAREADHTVAVRLRDEFDLIDCWQTVHPDEPLAQTLRGNQNREVAFHCDGIFVPATWRSRLRNCRVISDDDWNMLSDHNPMIAEFE